MATLTASGLNGADGTLNGQYTGTAYNYTTHPIGTIIQAYYANGSLNLNNSSPVVYASSGVQQNFYVAENWGGGTAYAQAGTWRSRGRGAYTGDGFFYILQRVA